MDIIITEKKYGGNMAGFGEGLLNMFGKGPRGEYRGQQSGPRDLSTLGQVEDREVKIRKPIPIEPLASIYVLREGKEGQELTDAQEKYVQARENVLGPEATGDITDLQLVELVQTGLKEVQEAIEQSPAGNMDNRDNTPLGSLKVALENALEILEHKRPHSKALSLVVERAVQEEMLEANAKKKEILGILSTARRVLQVRKDGRVALIVHRNDGVGRVSKEMDDQKANELPVKVNDRAEKVRAYIKERFGQE